MSELGDMAHHDVTVLDDEYGRTVTERDSLVVQRDVLVNDLLLAQQQRDSANSAAEGFEQAWQSVVEQVGFLEIANGQLLDKIDRISTRKPKKGTIGANAHWPAGTCRRLYYAMGSGRPVSRKAVQELLYKGVKPLVSAKVIDSKGAVNEEWLTQCIEALRDLPQVDICLGHEPENDGLPSEVWVAAARQAYLRAKEELPKARMVLCLMREGYSASYCAWDPGADVIDVYAQDPYCAGELELGYRHRTLLDLMAPGVAYARKQGKLPAVWEYGCQGDPNESQRKRDFFLDAGRAAEAVGLDALCAFHGTGPRGIWVPDYPTLTEVAAGTYFKPVLGNTPTSGRLN